MFTLALTRTRTQKGCRFRADNVLSWPAQSPYLNPTENLWAIMKRRLNRYDTPPKGLFELWSCVGETFPSITVDDCKRLIESIPNK